MLCSIMLLSTIPVNILISWMYIIVTAGIDYTFETLGSGSQNQYCLLSITDLQLLNIFCESKLLPSVNYKCLSALGKKQ